MSSTCGYPVIPEPFAVNTIFLPLNCFGTAGTEPGSWRTRVEFSRNGHVVKVYGEVDLFMFEEVNG